MTNTRQNTTECRRLMKQRSASLRLTLPSSFCKALDITAKDIMVCKLQGSKITLEKLTQ